MKQVKVNSTGVWINDMMYNGSPEQIEFNGIAAVVRSNCGAYMPHALKYLDGNLYMEVFLLRETDKPLMSASYVPIVDCVDAALLN